MDNKDMPIIIGPDGLAVIDQASMDTTTNSVNQLAQPVPTSTPAMAIQPPNNMLMQIPINTTPTSTQPQLTTFVAPPQEAINNNYTTRQLQQYAMTSQGQPQGSVTTPASQHGSTLAQQIMSPSNNQGPFLNNVLAVNTNSPQGIPTPVMNMNTNVPPMQNQVGHQVTPTPPMQITTTTMQPVVQQSTGQYQQLTGQYQQTGQHQPMTPINGFSTTGQMFVNPTLIQNPSQSVVVNEQSGRVFNLATMSFQGRQDSPNTGFTPPAPSQGLAGEYFNQATLDFGHQVAILNPSDANQTTLIQNMAVKVAMAVPMGGGATLTPEGIENVVQGMTEAQHRQLATNLLVPVPLAVKAFFFFVMKNTKKSHAITTDVIRMRQLEALKKKLLAKTFQPLDYHHAFKFMDLDQIPGWKFQANQEKLLIWATRGAAMIQQTILLDVEAEMLKLKGKRELVSNDAKKQNPTFLQAASARGLLNL